MITFFSNRCKDNDHTRPLKKNVSLPFCIQPFYYESILKYFHKNKVHTKKVK